MPPLIPPLNVGGEKTFFIVERMVEKIPVPFFPRSGGEGQGEEKNLMENPGGN
jgi:hypothetical protein